MPTGRNMLETHHDYRDSDSDAFVPNQGDAAGGLVEDLPARRSTLAAVAISVGITALLVGVAFFAFGSPPAAMTARSTGPGVATAIGKSVQGRPIVAYSCGSGRRRTLVVGGIHGDELGAEVADLLKTRLESQPSLVPSDSRIDIIPDANPDGRFALARGNANGVDLNRNFPSANWSSALSKHDTQATAGLTGGAAAGSEPETKALIEYLRPGFATVVTLHSHGGLVDFDGAGGEAVARRVSDAIGLPVRHLPYQASIRGSMGLYVPEQYGIPVITIELESSQLSSATLAGILAAASHQ